MLHKLINYIDRQSQPEKPRFVTLTEQRTPALVEPAYFAAFAP
jgi:hypothetical protein